MVDRVQELRNRVTDGYDKWKVRVTLPYTIAYSAAFDGYTKTMKEQAEVDKARAELFVSIASLVTGSILMATVAETSFRVIAGNAAINFVCERNLNQTFNAMSVAVNNKTVMFALGGALDVVDEQTSKAIKDALTKSFQSGTEIATSNPTAKAAELDMLLTKHKLAAIETGSSIEADKRMSEAKKHTAFAALHAAPICTPPTNGLNTDALSKKIELCFYLKSILESTELTHFSRIYFGSGPDMGQSEKITVPPSSPKYPKESMPTFQHGGQAIGIDRPRGVVRARIDELHKEALKAPFYNNGGFLSFGDVSGPEKMLEIRRAEASIDKLSREVRPVSTLEIKS